jgi:hypothetical protein
VHTGAFGKLRAIAKLYLKVCRMSAPSKGPMLYLSFLGKIPNRNIEFYSLQSRVHCGHAVSSLLLLLLYNKYPFFKSNNASLYFISTGYFSSTGNGHLTAGFL